MTEVVRDAATLRAALDASRAAGAHIGLVPTMGALHEGHLSLMHAAREHGAEQLVASIFVNPLQFGEGEDFERYPRTLDTDLEACRKAGIEWVYAPEARAMYPAGFQTHVEVGELTRTLEGRYRPGHFRGVTTVVAKLFQAAQPCTAVFGRKDFQQWRVLERMATDLDMPVRVVGCPIVREEDGLALSSRNRYLDEAQRRRALGLHRGLSAACVAYDAGERDAETLRASASAEVETCFDRVDYVEIRDAETLQPLRGEVADGSAVLLAAAHLGDTRLIDNVWLGVDRLS